LGTTRFSFWLTRGTIHIHNRVSNVTDILWTFPRRSQPVSLFANLRQ
jgi:hypothetical protein